MPTAALMPAMMVECAAYGLTTGLMLCLVRTGKTYADLCLSLVAAMLVGRLVSGVTKALFFMAGQYTMQAWIAASFVTALPGIVLQLAVVPSIVYYLMRAGLSRSATQDEERAARGQALAAFFERRRWKTSARVSVGRRCRRQGS